jgi:alpha-tubulin suppressor-like RCC1 family protein
VRPSFTLHRIYTKQFYRDKILSPEISSDENLRTPTVAKWLDGVALRDLQLHQKHAACIDARGDVYQWGEGFFGEAVKGVHSPKLTLRSKVRLSASARKGQWANAKRL